MLISSVPFVPLGETDKDAWISAKGVYYHNNFFWAPRLYNRHSVGFLKLWDKDFNPIDPEYIDIATQGPDYHALTLMYQERVNRVEEARKLMRTYQTWLKKWSFLTFADIKKAEAIQRQYESRSRKTVRPARTSAKRSYMDTVIEDGDSHYNNLYEKNPKKWRDEMDTLSKYF